MNVAVVVPAAGQGTRLGGVAKPLVELAGQPMLLHALRPFLADERVTSVIVALRAADALDPPAWLTRLDPRIRVVPGGSERGDSVRAALEALPAGVDIVLVHDAARPLVMSDTIDRAIVAAAAGHSAVVGVPVSDTIKEVDAAGRVVGTPDRGRLWQAQTPQAFPRAVLLAAYRRAVMEGVSASDDAALVARLGVEVLMVHGESDNIKVTTPADLAMAESVLRSRGK